jgi:hypothetical protein
MRVFSKIESHILDHIDAGTCRAVLNREMKDDEGVTARETREGLKQLMREKYVFKMSGEDWLKVNWDHIEYDSELSRFVYNETPPDNCWQALIKWVKNLV